MKRVLKTAALLLVPGSLIAGPLVYQPVNPSFGGNPLNGPNLLNQANSQNKLTDPNAQSFFGRTGTSQLDLFNQRLQSLILDRIATSLSDSLFDCDNLKPGVVETSTFLIVISPLANGNLLVTTTDKSTGASTSFEISQ
jgi:curli production assembly/transport component CsgF